MITILGNVGNAGYALPMVQAYPTDPNVQQLLAWDPTNQALNYVSYTGNALGDFGVTRDLSVGRDVAVTRNATIGGTLGVAGVLTTQNAAPAVIPNIQGPVVISNSVPANATLTATGTLQGLTLKAVSGANNAELQSTQMLVQGTKVVGTRDTGWTAMTGTPQKTTAATGTVTLPQLAGIVMALQAAMIAHGLIGA